MLRACSYHCQNCDYVEDAQDNCIHINSMGVTEVDTLAQLHPDMAQVQHHLNTTTSLSPHPTTQTLRKRATKLGLAPTLPDSVRFSLSALCHCCCH